MKPVLAQRLRAARQAIIPEVTQRDVAKHLALSPSAINLWEAGKTEPSASALAELSRWYRVSCDWLLGVEGGKQSASSTPPAPGVHTVPVVPHSAIARWHWDAVVELLQTAVEYPAKTAAAVQVSGDAMASVCSPGSYVVISKGDVAGPGDVVLAVIGKSNDPVLRKYVREGGTDLLVADDTRFPTYRLEDDVSIIGRVAEVTVRRLLPPTSASPRV